MKANKTRIHRILKLK